MSSHNDFYKKIFDLAPGLIVLTDSNFRYIDVNNRYHITFSNKESKDYIGKELGFSPINVKNKDEIEKLKSLLKENKIIYNVEVELFDIDNNIRILLVSASEIHFNNEKYYLFTGEDITLYKNLLTKYEKLNDNLNNEIEKAINKIKEQQKLLLLNFKFDIMGETIHLIAHHWRQPLNVVSNINNILKLKIMKNDFDKDSFLDYLMKSSNIVKDMSNIIDDFTNFLSFKVMKSNVNIISVIEEVLGLLSYSLDKNHIRFTSSCEDDIVLELSEAEIKVLLINVIVNAEEALIRDRIIDPKIDIVCKIEDNYFEISIRDNAKGINSNIIDKIYDPYFSIKSKNSHGLGLYLSKIIVERINGKLVIESAENKGTLVKIMIPLNR